MNNSNNSDECKIPASALRWNWGAFLLNWIWGLGNRTYIALLCLIPGVNLVMIFLLGAMGGRWAWKKGKWKNAYEFGRRQALWSALASGMVAGAIVMIIIFAAALVITFNNVFM